MKQIVGTDVGTYAFNATAKTITLSGLVPLNLEKILLVTNVTRNKIYYTFNAGPGASIASNVITFTASTTGHADGDQLQIIIDYPAIATPLPTGGATAANQATEISALNSIASNTSSAATAANQATEISALGAIASNTSATATATSFTATNGATESTLAALAGIDFATQNTLALVLAKLSADPATQTTLVAILAKIIAAPATEAKQDVGNTSLASILAKIIAAPATEAKQDVGNTSLASILAKIIAAPATEAKQDVGNTSLASILAKIIAAPATEAKQDSSITLIAKNESLRVDSTSTVNVTYIGKAVVGSAESSAVWKIFVIDTTTSIVKKLWAAGDSNSTHAWSGRTGFTYS